MQDVIDGKGLEDYPLVSGGWEWKDIEKDLFHIYDICKIMREKRFEGGALKIDKVKLLFRKMDENGIPTMLEEGDNDQ